jgi:hypothetical protein
MQRLRLFAASLVSMTFAACGGGGGSQPTPIGVTGGSASVTVPTASTPRQPATFTVTVPRSAGASTAASNARSAQYVSPSTAEFYISLQDAPGVGDRTYSFTENVDSTHCTGAGTTQVCSYTEQVPTGTDVFSIVAASGGPDPTPLSYAGVVNAANPDGGPVSATIGSTGTNAIQADLAPIAATAPGSYLFTSLNLFTAAPSLPYFTLQFLDLGGNALPERGNGSEFNGFFVNPVTISDTSPFTAELLYVMPTEGLSIPLGTSYTFPEPQPFYLDLNGFVGTQTITITVPPVQISQTEFPQLPTSTLNAPGWSQSYTITCATETDPTVSPCSSGTVPATFTITGSQRTRGR